MRFVKRLANYIKYWHMFLTWFTYVLTISPFGNLWQTTTNKWTYEISHKSLNSYSLVEYNKIYPNKNSWKNFQEESSWQEESSPSTYENNYSHLKTTPPFCHKWQRASTSSRHLIIIRRASTIVLISISLLEPLSLSSLEADGDGEEATMKPPMVANHHVIRLTRVFT